MSAQNKIKELNTCAISSITYSFVITKCPEFDFEQLNRDITVLFKKHRARHPKFSVERILDLKTAYLQSLEDLRKFFQTKSETSTYHSNKTVADNKLHLTWSDKYYKPIVHIITADQKIEKCKSKELHGSYPAMIVSNEWLNNGNIFLKPKAS